MSGQTVMEAVNQAVVTRVDDWSNEVLGIGGTKDPSVYTTFAPRGAGLSDAVLEALYVEEHFAAKVVECVVKHGMRKGWDLVLPGDPTAAGAGRAAYATEEARLGVAEEMYQGACWGRLFGGAVTWIGADDRRAPEQPLNESAIERVLFLHTFDRRDVVVHSRYADPAHPKFQEPETYRITPRVVGAVASLTGAFAFGRAEVGGAVVHESRLVVWPGEGTTDQRKLERNGWDDSVLERCWAALKQTGEDYAGKSLLLGRISQTVIKIKGFAAIVASMATAFRLRLGLINAARSRSNMIPIDTEESIENVTQPIGGVDGLIDRSVERLASAADIPLTIFVGRPPTGASADAELETWNAEVESWQTSVLAPRHARIARLIMASKKGPLGGEVPDGWSIRYRPLRTPKPKEVAEVRKIEAETDAIEIDKGVITAEDVAIGRHTLTGDPRVILSDETIAKKKARRDLLDGQPPKDNAELGTIGPRAAAAMDVVAKVASGVVSRETGKQVLVQFFRLTDEQAEQMLGPTTFVPRAATEKNPGPGPAPAKGEGAGAPPPLPGYDDGGDPATKTLPKGT